MHDLIYGQGYEDSDLCIISDYTRKADSVAGHCLSGYYKNKLNEYLRAANYSVDQCYRTCIVKRYIQGLGVDTFQQDKKLLEWHYETGEASLSEYLTLLLQELNDIKPRVILCLGEYALRLLTGKDGIGKWRGSVLPLSADITASLTYELAPTVKVLSTYHPNVIHKEEHLQYIIRQDFKKAVDLVFDPNRAIDNYEVHIARSSIDFIRFIEEYPISKFPKMTYDIETHYGFITCAGISLDGYKGITIPMWGATKYDITDRARMMYLMSQLLQERDLINQNIGYDRRVSQRYGLWMRNIIWDTMLAANVIACEFPKRLDFLTSIYTDMSFYKDEGHEFDPRYHDIDQLYSYNCKDAITTFQIYNRQVEDLKEADQLEFFEQFVMRLFELYYDMDSVGLLQDTVKQRELLGKYEGLYSIKLLELKAIVTTYVEDIDINKFISSPTQIGKFLEVMSFPVLRHRVASGYMVVNTDYDSFKKMRLSDPVEYRSCKLPYEQALRFINLVLLLRRIDKVLEYIAVGPHPDGRIRTSYKIAGTTSGRTSGSQTSDGYPIWTTEKGKFGLKFKQCGQSFQTITKHGFIIEGEEDEDITDGIIGKDIREMYICDPHFVLIEADGAQAEARVCDVLGEDWEGLIEYNTIDKHCKVASLIFPEFSYEDILRMSKKEKTDEGIFMRNIGKHAKHGKNNGLKPVELAKRYIPISDHNTAVRLATHVLKQVDRAYPNIEQVFHKQVEQHLRDERMLISPRPYGLPSGRRRMFYKKIDGHYINVAYSHLPQSTVTDHTKAAALRIMDQVDRCKVYMVAENHDSITSLVHWSWIRKYCNIAKRELERPIDFRGCSLSRDYELVIPAEFSIGKHNWGKMKEPKMIKWDN